MKYAVEMGSGAKFHKDWFMRSKVNRGDSQTNREHGDRIKGPIHDQSCCPTLRVVQHDCPYMVLIDLIVNGQTCVAQNNFAQHDSSCMGRIRLLSFFKIRKVDQRYTTHYVLGESLKHRESSARTIYERVETGT
jgi:hypothetical protein